MSNFREYKVRYSHGKAREVLKKLGAGFTKKELLEDFYLVSGEHDIFKIARTGEKIRFIHLVNKGGSFDKVSDVELEPSAKNELVAFFDTGRMVMRKEREHYQWNESRIVLDGINDLGEFIEFYPATDKERQKLFAEFQVNEEDLITESYYSLSKRL